MRREDQYWLLDRGETRVKGLPVREEKHERAISRAIEGREDVHVR